MTTLAVLGFLLLVAIMVALYIIGAHQVISVLALLVVFPLLIFVGSKRKMARGRAK